MADIKNEASTTPPFEDVKDQFQFTGFDDAQREVILGQLEQAWNTDSGQTMLQDGLDNNGLHYLNVNDQSVISSVAAKAGMSVGDVPAAGNFAIPSQGEVYLNGYDALDANGKVQAYSGLDPSLDGQLATADTPIRSLDTDGEVFSVPPVYTMLHETNHAARNVPDIPRTRPNGIEYDQTMSNTNSTEAAQAYYGANEVDTQKILAEMGLDQHRGAYSGTAALKDVDIGADYGLDRDHAVGVTTFDGIDMTGHSPVDTVVVGATAAEVKALAPGFSDAESVQFVSNEYKLGDANDTVHTFDGADNVYTGGGDDRVFLGEGKDIAHAGWGNNTIDGGDANLDPASDHKSNTTTDWGIDSVDYTTLKTGFAAPDALSVDSSFDGVARDGVLITIDADEISVNKGQQYAPAPGEDIDKLHNIDAVKGSSRDDLAEVSELSGDQALDGAGGTDTLVINTLPDGSTATDVAGPVTFNGTGYDGYVSDGADKLYYKSIENLVIEQPEAAAPVGGDVDVNDAAPVIPPIDASLDGAPSPHILPMENAVRILHEEGAEAVELERASGIENGPISTLINTPAGVSVMETLVAHGDRSIEVDPADLEGDAHSRVSSVLRGSMERIQEIGKVDEFEARNAEHLEQSAEVDTAEHHTAAPQPTQVVEAELEYEYGL